VCPAWSTQIQQRRLSDCVRVPYTSHETYYSFPLVLLPDYWFWWNKDFRNTDIHTLICCSSKPRLSTGTSRLQGQGAYPLKLPPITFRVSRTRREMYCGHARLFVCLFAAACLHYCMDPDVTWGSGRGCHLVVHCWADLQSVHGFRCYGNITRTRNVSEYMLYSMLLLLATVRLSSLVEKG